MNYTFLAINCLSISEGFVGTHPCKATARESHVCVLFRGEQNEDGYSLKFTMQHEMLDSL